MTRDQVAAVLDTFINRATQGTEMRPVADASWVDFITTAIADPALDQIRERCLNLDSSRRCAAGNTAIPSELQCCVTSHVTSDLKIEEHLKRIAIPLPAE